MADKAKRIEFDLPPEFSVPEGVATDGKGEFDALATIRLKKDGKACLVALDSYRMPGYREADDKEPEDTRSYSEAASEGMMEGY